jgi:hypothetical protein
MRSLYRPSTVIEAWLELMRPDHGTQLRALMRAVQAGSARLEPMVKWGGLVFAVDGHPVLALQPCRRFVHLQVFNGQALQRRFPMLRGHGPGTRTLRMRLSEPLDLDLAGAIARAAAG